MFPIRDHNPSHRTPWVTWALIAINVLIWVAGLAVIPDEGALAAFYEAWALIPAEVTSGRDLHGAFTSMFLHASLLHLAGNMLFLWVFGDNLEDQMGHVGFLIFYLAAGLAAAAAHIIPDPSSQIPTVGASGAIAGVMGGYLLLFPRARIDVFFFFVVFFRIIPIPAWLVLGLWFVMQVLGGWGTTLEGGGVAYWAHAGGFVAGFLLALPLWLARGGPDFWQRPHGVPPHPGTVYARSTIPVVPRRR
ncbi:MAG: rhomboid family intramembrane serine protease [Rhodobacteraceae bacterium]|nr:rhomboid family intramembrane serine protease [Paracoccaceae bacterium]